MALLDEVLLLLQRCETTSPVSDDGINPTTSEERLSQELEATKRTLLLKCEATRDTRWLVVLCHVVNQFASWLIVAAPTAAPLPSTDVHVRMNKCVFLLENAVTTSLHSLQRTIRHMASRDDNTDDSAMEVDAGAGRERRPSQHQGSKSLLVSSYWSLFEGVLASFSDEDSGNRSRSTAAAILSRLGLLLSICWLTVDRNALLPDGIELLSAAAHCCERYGDTRSSAKGPLLLLGLLHLVEKRDNEQALQSFRTAVMLQSASSNIDQDGAFHYWFGVALFKNGHVREATDQLQRCLRCNYAPIASLNLSALAHLRDNGAFHASSLKMQRALEIDFLESVTLFNYAALLGGMHSFAAQQQMLEYYQEAMHPEGSVETERKRVRSGTPRSKRDGAARAPTAELFAEAQLTALFAPNATHVTPAMLSSQLAYAAMENGDWEQAKQSFEELVAVESNESEDARMEVYRDYIYVLLQSNLHTLALENCDRVLKFTRDDDSSDGVREVSLLLIHLYRADALLSLERVLDCHQYLRETVEPRIRKLLPQPQRQPQHQPSNRSKPKLTSESPTEEVAACHIQLLNNLAVVTACQDDDDTGVDTAIAMLQGGIHLHPQALSLKFNLVLLLWRKQQREAACSIWFEARGWSLHMDARDVGDDQKAIEMVTSAEEAAILAAAHPHPQVSEHVRSSIANEEDDGVVRQQLLYLDALVLNHWGKIQSSRVIETSVGYIQYLDSLSTSRRNARNSTSDQL